MRFRRRQKPPIPKCILCGAEDRSIRNVPSLLVSDLCCDCLVGMVGQ